MEAEDKKIQAVGPSYSTRFTNMVVKEFGGQVGKLELTPYQQILAKHLFIGIDKALTDLDAKRIKDGQTSKSPIVWTNINMQKLAIDSVHRIELGLDALIANHIHVIPYFNGKLKKYDLDLAVGYVGKDYYKREMSLEKPKDIIYRLVYETDDFVPFFKDKDNDVEIYKFTVKNPFKKRGQVIGGFGYIIYEDPTKNKLVVVTKDSMDKSKKLAKTNTFWASHEDNMQMVCIVRRTTAQLNVDPKKINLSYATVELDENAREIQENANQDFIDILPEPEKEKEVTKPVVEEEKKEEPKQKSGEIFLHCPPEINKNKPRKPVSVCGTCKNSKQCNIYQEYLMEQDGSSVDEGIPDF